MVNFVKGVNHKRILCNLLFSTTTTVTYESWSWKTYFEISLFFPENKNHIYCSFLWSRSLYFETTFNWCLLNQYIVLLDEQMVIDFSCKVLLINTLFGFYKWIIFNILYFNRIISCGNWFFYVKQVLQSTSTSCCLPLSSANRVYRWGLTGEIIHYEIKIKHIL